MLLTPFAADAKDEKTASFVAKYEEKCGVVPNQFAADAYDGIYALAAACEKAGVTAETPVEEACDMLIAAFQEIQVEGLTGTMTWKRHRCGHQDADRCRHQGWRIRQRGVNRAISAYMASALFEAMYFCCICSIRKPALNRRIRLERSTAF